MSGVHQDKVDSYLAVWRVGSTPEKIALIFCVRGGLNTRTMVAVFHSKATNYISLHMFLEIPHCCSSTRAQGVHV